MTIQTKEDLDEKLAGGCQAPGCKHEHEKMSELFINSHCHPGIGLDVCYNAEGLLILTCHFCDSRVTMIKVGDR